MPCMCGDTHCWSCGPAQGNSKCPICNAWADDGCEHISEETGELLPEFEAQAVRLDLLEREAEDRMYAEMQKEFEEYDRMINLRP